MRKEITSILMFLGIISAKAEQADTLRVINLDEVSVVSPVKVNGAMRQQAAAVSLIGHEQLTANHITSLKGTSNIVPNLFIPDYGSRLTSAIYIRGIGSRINTPAVGLYVDNIPYVDKSAFDFNLYDIERIDVLRGPQGVLYGRNTMGGLINVYTKNPLYYNGTDARLSYATGDNHRSVSLAHYHRLSNTLAVSAGGYYEGGDGFFDNVTTGKKADGMQAGGGRMRSIWKPSQRWMLDLAISYDYTDEKAYPYFYTGALNGTEPYADLIGKISNNRENRYRRNLFSSGLNIEHKGDGWQLNAVTAYQNICDRMFLDQDFLRPDIYTLEQRQRINTLTEEVTLRHDKSKWWKSVSGVNMMYQWLKTDGPVNFMEDGVSTLIEGNINGIFARLQEQNDKMPTMKITLQDKQFEVSSKMDTPQFSAAAFHQSTFTAGNFDFTLGARLEYNDRRLDYLSGTSVMYDFNIVKGAMNKLYTPPAAAPLRNGTLKDHDLQFLPKVSAQYNLPQERGNIYASVSKGYRSGGYNVQMFSDIIQGDMRSAMMVGINEISDGMMERFVDMKAMTAQQDVSAVTYKPEHSWNYEMGSHLTLLDRTLWLDVAIFYSRIYDQQIARFAPSGLGRMMVNAGRSQSCGGEMSLRWMPERHITLLGNYGYTHATFLEYDDGQGSDYAKKYVPFVPMHNINLDAAYTWYLNDNDDDNWLKVKSITLGANASGTGRIYWTESNSVSQPFYALLGARLAVETSHFSLMLWTKNITGKRYNTFYFESASRGFEQHGKPFQLGVDLNVKF